MSYNNIGLKSAKGSSTSGHIQRSLASASKYNQNFNKRKGRVTRERKEPTGRDHKLLDHLGKREIEVRVSEYRDELEDGSDDEDTIDRKCEELRNELRSTQQQRQQQRQQNEQQHELPSDRISHVYRSRQEREAADE